MLDKKIIDSTDISHIREANQDKKIMFVSGCFDIFHVGHLKFLEEAANKADLLVVGVLSDEFVKKRKGETRPIFSEMDRLTLISHLDIVNYAFILTSENREIIISSLLPDYYGVGGDRDVKNIPEQKYLSQFKVKILPLSLFESDSTSVILEKLKKQLS